eukprot:7389930-Prymnesium_polylepis.2
MLRRRRGTNTRSSAKSRPRPRPLHRSHAKQSSHPDYGCARARRARLCGGGGCLRANRTADRA